MLRVIVQPYAMNSMSSKAIADALDVYRIHMGRNTFVPTTNHLIINWGSHRLFDKAKYLNHPSIVSIAANKLKTFKLLKGKVPIVDFTSDKAKAEQWVSVGHTVFARKYLNASEGKGIVVCTTLPIPNAPLYTKYKKKRKEFRVHVFQNEVLSVQEKRKRHDWTVETSNIIRSYRLGWVFCRENVVEPTKLRDVATKAVEALGLDFGAVDIIWNEQENRCYVLEVNTAPGLEGSSTSFYANAFKEYIQKQNAQGSPAHAVDFPL